jgi:hypothetical protein
MQQDYYQRASYQCVTSYDGSLAIVLRCVRLYDSESMSECYIMTDVQSASLSWNEAPVWGLLPDFYYCQTVPGLLMWGALSDEGTGLSFPIASGPRHRSHFQIRVPWDSWKYVTIPDSRLPFSSPPTTRKVTVEVFEPASARDWYGFCISPP